MQYPVVFFIFNRPEKTAQVFAEICRAQPPQLFIVADGPRSNHPTDKEKVAATREIVKHINWPCQVTTNFSDSNLGCKKRIASGIDWVFEQVDATIILEDDCVPDQSFFQYCDELLERYKDDHRIAMISGANHQDNRIRGDGDYYFSRYGHYIWGWATWKRAWKAYDVNIKEWPKLKAQGWLKTFVYNDAEFRYWNAAFQSIHLQKVDTWDYQWDFAVMKNKWLSLIPRHNLINNIGFDNSASHTGMVPPAANFDVTPITFPIKHPKLVSVCEDADIYSSNKTLQRPPFVLIVLRRILREFAKLLK